MRGHTHATIGLIVYFLYLSLYNVAFSRSSLLFAFFMSLLPDIDTPYSTISRTTFITKYVSEKINVALGHRGPLHSLFFRSVFTVILRVFYSSYYISYTSYVVGSLAYLSHIVADMFTPKGVPLFRPIIDSRITICKRRGFRRAICIKTGSSKEEMLEIFLTFILLAVIGLYLGLYPRDFTRSPSILPQSYSNYRRKRIISRKRNYLITLHQLFFREVSVLPVEDEIIEPREIY